MTTGQIQKLQLLGAEHYEITLRVYTAQKVHQLGEHLPTVHPIRDIIITTTGVVHYT